MKQATINILCTIALLSACNESPGVSSSGYGRTPQIIGSSTFTSEVQEALHGLDTSEYSYLSGIVEGHEPTCARERIPGYYDAGTGQAGICREGRHSITELRRIIRHENDVHAKCHWRNKGINADHDKDC